MLITRLLHCRPWSLPEWNGCQCSRPCVLYAVNGCRCMFRWKKLIRVSRDTGRGKIVFILCECTLSLVNTLWWLVSFRPVVFSPRSLFTGLGPFGFSFFFFCECIAAVTIEIGNFVAVQMTWTGNAGEVKLIDRTSVWSSPWKETFPCRPTGRNEKRLSGNGSGSGGRKTVKRPIHLSTVDCIAFPWTSRDSIIARATRMFAEL